MVKHFTLLEKIHNAGCAIINSIKFLVLTYRAAWSIYASVNKNIIGSDNDLVPVRQFSSIGSDNGLAPNRHQVIIWTNTAKLIIYNWEHKLQLYLKYKCINFHTKCVWQCRLQNGGYFVPASMRGVQCLPQTMCIIPACINTRQSLITFVTTKLKISLPK